jgi:hypothetical protein
MVTFVGNKNQERNITLKKKKKRKNASRRIRLKPPVMVTLKSSEPVSLLHYHFLSGFRNPFNLNVPAQNQPANPSGPNPPPSSAGSGDDDFRTPRNDGGLSPISIPQRPHSGPPTGLLTNRRGRIYREIPLSFTPTSPVSLGITASPSVFAGSLQDFEREGAEDEN